MRSLWAVGVDFGGTNIKVGLVNRQGRVVRATALSTARVGNPRAFIPAVSQVIGELTASVGIRPARLRGVVGLERHGIGLH